MQHDFILLDRSGSMGTKWVETLGAVNGYVQKLAEDKVDTGVTLALFDDSNGIQFDVVRDRITPSTWLPVTDKDGVPRGYTPLNDAIGRIVAMANKGINGEQYDKVAIIIVTDGLENASKEIRRHEEVKQLLDGCRNKNWQVIFLGADYDNLGQAASYGSSANQTMDSVDPKKMGLVSASLAATRSAYGATGKAMEFEESTKAGFRK